MPSIGYDSKLLTEPFNKFLCFGLAPLFMCFHGQKDKISLFCSFVGGEQVESLGDHLNFLFIAGQNEAIINLLSNIESLLIIWHSNHILILL